MNLHATIFNINMTQHHFPFSMESFQYIGASLFLFVIGT